LTVDGITTDVFELSWEQLQQTHKCTYSDLQDTTELGAYGVALLLIKELTGQGVVERSAKGGGFDWWIGDPDPSGLPFQQKRRLEVSGILNDHGGSLESRIRQKRRQTDPSDSLGPAIIAVVEFGEPKIQVEHK
jgi:hypothetical protein